ncbi:MAG: FGGY family carbohydrate kinase, partial [Chryseolinea sp.]
MTTKEVILIFDIGKTTKKALLFDKEFHVIEEKTEVFKEIPDDDGFPSDNLAAVSTWVVELINHYTADSKYKITHCNFSAYGASFVHMDERGKPAGSFYNYLKPFPPEIKKKFHDQYDAKNTLQAETASPYLGLLNSGLQLYWMKYAKPEVFNRVKHSLHLPQYFAFLLSGQYFSDITSIGCHTMLWDFEEENYHEWIFSEDVQRLLTSIHRPDHSIEVQFNKKKFRMGIGVHDSSGALMPYMATQQEPFLLLSTGTWNICFNPSNNDPLTSDELASDCLCYLTYEGSPVKASRIFLGREHEMQTELLATHFKTQPDAYTSIVFREEIFQALCASDSYDNIFYPVGMEGTGPLPQKQQHRTNLSVFENLGQAYHQLMRYLIRWQMMSIDLVDPNKRVKNIIVVGGFTKNKLFLEILKRECKGRRIMISDHPRASALGAAWLVCDKDMYEGKANLLQLSEI